MAFDSTDYLSWYIPRIRGEDEAINLHSSGVPPLDFDALDPPRGNAWTMAPGFESALADWLGIESESLTYTPGATGGTLLSLLALGVPEASFVVEEPIYEPMLRQPQRLGPVHRLIRRPSRRWELDLDAAKALIRPDTAAVLLTEPHNPSGVFAPRDQVLALAELAARQDALLLINEVYLGFTDQPSYHGVADNVLVVNSLSKLCGAYAARLGWVSGPRRYIRRLRSAAMNYSMPSAPSAAVGIPVMERIDALVREARRRSSLVDLVDSWVTDTPGVSWVRPEGPGFGCIALPAGTDDQAFVEDLHRDQQVLLVPGRLWEAPGSVRLSWLQTDEASLRVGLERLGAAVRALGAP